MIFCLFLHRGRNHKLVILQRVTRNAKKLQYQTPTVTYSTLSLPITMPPSNICDTCTYQMPQEVFGCHGWGPHPLRGVWKMQMIAKEKMQVSHKTTRFRVPSSSQWDKWEDAFTSSGTSASCTLGPTRKISKHTQENHEHFCLHAGLMHRAPS